MLTQTRLRGAGRRRAFSLAELLIVIGVIALLVAIVVPPLQLARRQAMDAVCASQLQQVGISLEAVHTEFSFYPLWDDSAVPVPFTWVDVLIQRRFLGQPRIGYCPLDELPDPLNEARGRAAGLVYPGNPARSGVDYSYGIGVPLSAGGWAWRPGYGHNQDDRPRRFEDADRDPSRRVLAADSNWSAIYNLNGRGATTGVWNDQSWYDNTVAWRHGRGAANLLMRDGHVRSLKYNAAADEPVNTAQQFLWYAGEPVNVGPDSRHGANYYPNTPPPSFQSVPKGDIFPSELLPFYFTVKRDWTLIKHKSPGVAQPGY